MARRRKRVRSAAQRAQLKRAQAISAKKRRRRKLKRNAGNIGKFLGTVAGTAAIYHVNRAARNPIKTTREAQSGYRKVRGLVNKRKVKKLGPEMPTTAGRKYWYSGGHRGYLI